MGLMAAVEGRGIEPVPAEERHGRARGLGGVWLAANLGILAVVLGAVVAAFGLDLAQAAAVTVAATAGSFLLVGAVSVAGAWSGMPSLTLSRRPFGRLGNLAPAGVSWVSILGWEVVTSVVAAYALADLAHVLFGLRASRAGDVTGLGIVVVASLGLGLFGHATIVRFQRWVSWIFGGLSLLVVPFLFAGAHWSPAAGSHPAPWGSVLAAGSIVAAGTGISWVNLAPDYSRYLPRSEKPLTVVAWVTAAASLPAIVIVLAGYVLSAKVPGLASSLNPVAPVGAVLPSWMAAPYLLVAVGAMLAETDLACYSSGLNLLALGVRTRRSRTILVDAGVVLAGGLYLVLVPGRFLSSFESFLLLLAPPLAAWAGVVLADMARGRRVDHELHYRSWPAVGWVGVAAWSAGTAAGLLTTVSPWFRGWLAVGFLAEGSFGFALALAVAFLASAAGWRVAARRQGAGMRSPAAAPASGLEPAGTGAGLSFGRRGGAVFGGRPCPDRLVVAGSILVDVLLYVEAMPERGGDVLAHERLICSGGGFNVLTAASRLGLPAAYAGRIGAGVFGRQVARDLEKAGIAALLPPVPGEDTGFDIGVVEADGERRFLTAPGTESRLGAADLGLIRLRAGDAIYVSGYDLSYPQAGPALSAWLAALPAPHLVAVDPGPLAAADPAGGLQRVLQRVDLLSANEREALLLTRCDSAASAAEALAARIAPGGLAVVRTGPDGCWLAGGDGAVRVPGRRVATVDTTGAGDIHVGAMLARLAAGDDAATAARWANAAASVAVTRQGGAAGPTASELAAVLHVPPEVLAPAAAQRSRRQGTRASS